MVAKINVIFGIFLLNALTHQNFGAPTNNLMCAEYIAPGINALPDVDDYKDYSDEYENSDDDQQTKAKSNVVGKELNRPKGVILCPNREVCFSVWRTYQNGSVIIFRQGCWKTENLETCESERCISNKPKSFTGSHRFCCCSDNMCNANITTTEYAEEPPTVNSYIESSTFVTIISIWTKSVTWICISLIVIIIAAIIFAYACRSNLKAQPELSPLSPSGPGYSSNLHNVDNLKLCGMIGQGKYGTVWKGMINEQPVAVKIFPGQHKQYFINEKNIYSVSLMDICPSLLEYYGCDTRRTLNDNIEYLLVLSLAPLGCLQDWLHENTTSFAIFTKMAKSVARGLSHLHTELKKNDLEKPCICHRDLNTRNILVKSDLSCCISDFGFALKAYGPRYEWKGEISLAETKSINEVGTLRYMSPEVLEGAVNLRDCETALKQIDIYSLGLVLWELCTRCHDWYPIGYEPPPYASPYEAEIGKCPSFEQMQVLVSRHKTRPTFPLHWGGGAAAKIAKETCEDCWDHDAEARLTALCAEERLHELSKFEPKNTMINGATVNQQITSTNVSNANVVRAIDTAKNLYNTDEEITIITPPNQILPNAEFVDKNRCLANPIHTFQTSNTFGSSTSTPKIIQNQILFEKTRKLQLVESGDENSSYSYVEESGSVEELIANKGKNSDRKMNGWQGVRALIQKKLFNHHPYENGSHHSDKSNIIDSALSVNASSPIKNAIVVQKLETTMQRPSNLNLQPTGTISTTSSIENGVRKPPGNHLNQAFTIINQTPKIVVSKSTNAMKSLSTMEPIDDKMLKRQRSLEVFREVFGTKGSIERLRDPSERVKTPGDVPPSVRKVRASKTLSLYDDRMMDTNARNTL